MSRDDPNRLTTLAMIEAFPNLYAATCLGDCMVPVFNDGATLVFQKDAPYAAGDAVGIWFRPEFKVPGEPQQYVKRLLSDWPHLKLPLGDTGNMDPVLVFERMNPRRRLYVPASRLLAIHKVVGLAEPTTNGMAAARMFKEGEPAWPR